MDRLPSGQVFFVPGYSEDPSNDFRVPITNEEKGLLKLPPELVGLIARDPSLAPRDVSNLSKTCGPMRVLVTLDARTVELSDSASHVVNSKDFKSITHRFSKEWIPNEKMRVKPFLIAIKSACGHSEIRYLPEEYWREDGRRIADPRELTEAFAGFIKLYGDYTEMDCRSRILAALAEGYSSLTPATRKKHRGKMEQEIKSLDPQSFAQAPLASYVKSFRAESKLEDRLKIFKERLSFVGEFEPLNGALALAELAYLRNYLRVGHDEAVRLLYGKIHPLLELDRAKWKNAVDNLEHSKPFNRGLVTELPDDIKDQIAADQAVFETQQGV